MLFAALSLVAQNTFSPYSSSRDMDKQGQSHQVTGQRRPGPWTGEPQGSISPMPGMSCSSSVPLGDICIWRPRRPSHRAPAAQMQISEGKQVQGQHLPCMGADGTMGQSEASDCQYSVRLCAQGWEQAGMTKARGQKGAPNQDPEVAQSRACPRDGPEVIFLTRKHKDYHEHEQ